MPIPGRDKIYQHCNNQGVPPKMQVHFNKCLPPRMQGPFLVCISKCAVKVVQWNEDTNSDLVASKLGHIFACPASWWCPLYFISFLYDSRPKNSLLGLYPVIRFTWEFLARQMEIKACVQSARGSGINNFSCLLTLRCWRSTMLEWSKNEGCKEKKRKI